MAAPHILPGSEGMEVMDSWPVKERKIRSNVVRDVLCSLWIFTVGVDAQ